MPMTTPSSHSNSGTDIRLPPSVTYDISVIIVSYNTCEMTIACVHSVLEHKGDLAIEIIVVDNQSSDGSSAALRREFPNITVIDSPANGGFAYGNAIGFEQALGRYILLLNPDTQVFAGGLTACVNYMNVHPKTGILGPRVRLENGTQQSSMMRFHGLKSFAVNIFLSAKLQRRTSLFSDPRYARLSREAINKVDAVSGCFMFTRREVLRAIGALDTRFFMYGEEMEWCHRAGQAGWEIVYNPEIEILHHGAASTAHMSKWKAIEMTRGQILFLRFTRGPFVAWLGTFLMALRDIVRLPYYGAAYILRGLKASEGFGPWWARLKFELSALLKQPTGQIIALPDPESVKQ